MPSGRLSRRFRRPRLRVLVAAVAAGTLVATLAGCSGVLSTSSGPDGSDYKGITIQSLRPRDSAALQTYYNQKPNWQSCSGGLLCATITAPVDWQHVTRSSIELALVKHPASGTSLGALVVNPGGPGGSGVDFVESGVTNVVDSNVAAHYDIVGFDPRGVGASSPVKCFDDAGMDNYLYGRIPGAIGSLQWIGAEEKRARSLASACEKNTGPVLAHIDSVSAASDLDLVRSALGESKLNYLGYSYGTYLGTLYAGLYPRDVGRMVLDGADDPWGANYQPTPDGVPAEDYSVSPQYDPAVAQAQGFEDDFNAYLQACLAGTKSAVGSASCPFSGGRSSADRAVHSLLDAANSQPLVAKDGRHLYAATLVTAITDSLYRPRSGRSSPRCSLT
jgi:pimeloyl-ACP methyl ester carboxylesterase